MSQTLAPVRETDSSPVSLRRVFVANARSEWTKLRTLRSTIWALVLTVIFTVGLGALFTGIEVSRWDHRTLTEAKGFDPLLYSFAGLNLAQLSIGVLGVFVMTSEYSTRTIKLTFAAAPQRTLLLGAKVATFSAAVAVVVRFPNLLSPAAGLIVLCAYTAATLTVAALALTRRDA
jgi:ABC-2 type transport system permease protein